MPSRILRSMRVPFATPSRRQRARDVSDCARPTRAFGGRALREHARHLRASDEHCFLVHLLFLESALSQSGVARPRLKLRASNEHFQNVRVPFAPSLSQMMCAGGLGLRTSSGGDSAS